jgi:putative phosphoribosyl transferase
MPQGAAEPIGTRSVRIRAGDAFLEGDLTVPPRAAGIVLFAHGSGSSRYSPRNQLVARTLQRGGFGTLLMDLLTQEEEAVDLRTRHLRFDIQLLADRLVAATDWLQADAEVASLPVGYFGASTGGGAALVAATQRPDVKAVVSRGGRPDLAGDALRLVRTPTLLIVGGADQPVIALNRQAQAQIPGTVKLQIIPGATHLFEEPGALEEVAQHSSEWFRLYLR